MDNETKVSAAYQPRQVSAAAKERTTEVPPRVFDLQEPPRPSSPYRTAAQAYPRHREESQAALNQEVSEQELWRGQLPSARKQNVPEEPETVIGAGVSIKGELRFQRFLRIDGEFEGELISDGKIIIGPTGVVRSNINLREAIVEGSVTGNINVRERLELRGEAKIYGNIEAKLLSIDEGVTLVGQLAVKPSHDT